MRSVPGMLDGVLRLPFEMVLTESFAFVEQQTALSRMSQALRRLRSADHDAISCGRSPMPSPIRPNR